MNPLRLAIVRWLLPLLAGLSFALTLPVTAQAQEGNGRGARQGGFPGGYPGGNAGNPGGYQGERRRGGDGMQRVPANDPQQFQRPGQMSPDERRALRRDIHDASRDVYRRQPQP